MSDAAFVYERPVRFEDVDAAQIIFFGRYFSYCHEAMEELFGGLEGGYVRLITERKLGLPAVRVEADYKIPLRYGDVVRIGVTTERIGNTSAALLYDFARKSDGAEVAMIRHVVVLCDLTTMRPLAIPADVRNVLELRRRGGKVS